METDPGHVTLVGARAVGGWVTAHPDHLVGTGARDWYRACGPESEVFAEYAQQLSAQLGARTGNSGPVWCSWYSFYREIAESTLREVLADIGDLPFAVFQIDDGWQRANGDWLPNDRFTRGMGFLADQVEDTARTAGLWLAPFLADADSELAGRYPDMLLCDADSRPIVAASNWGPETYALDVGRSDVLEWLEELVRTVVGWGYRYLKLDFLYAGALPRSPEERYGREDRYRRAVETIRAAAGDDVYLLACGAPIIPSIGVFDGIRVGPDVSPYWDNEDRTVHLADRAGPGTADAITTSLGRFWLRSVIDIDPDVAYFRSRRCLLTREQQTYLVQLGHVCGSRGTSDPPAWLDAGERAALESFLTTRPTVEQVDRYRFLVDGELVDFTPVAEARPW